MCCQGRGVRGAGPRCRTVHACVSYLSAAAAALVTTRSMATEPIPREAAVARVSGWPSRRARSTYITGKRRDDSARPPDAVSGAGVRAWTVEFFFLFHPSLFHSFHRGRALPRALSRGRSPAHARKGNPSAKTSWPHPSPTSSPPTPSSPPAPPQWASARRATSYSPRRSRSASAWTWTGRAWRRWLRPPRRLWLGGWSSRR
jgi:hypothetical protein